MSSGWLLDTAVCHPDDISYHRMSSGWLSRNRYLIRMSYDNVIMSSGWHRLPFLSHPDEIVNFDFPHHAVALQRFRKKQTCEVVIKPQNFSFTKMHRKISSAKWRSFCPTEDELNNECPITIELDNSSLDEMFIRHQVIICTNTNLPSTHLPQEKWPPFRLRHIQCIVANEKFYIFIRISLKFIAKGPIGNGSALV